MIQYEELRYQIMSLLFMLILTGSFTYDGETKECFLSSFWRDNNGLQNLLRDMELNSPVIIAYFANRISGCKYSPAKIIETDGMQGD